MRHEALQTEYSAQEIANMASGWLTVKTLPFMKGYCL